MFRPYLAYLALALTALMAPNNAQAWLWGLFGHRDENWRMMDPDRQTELAASLMDKAAERLAEGRLASAYEHYEKVWKQYPGSKFAPEAVYQMGRIAVQQQKWKRAYTAYLSLIQSYPETEHFNDVISDIFTIAEGYEKGINIHYLWVIPYRDNGKAVTVYESLVSAAPYSDYAAISLIRVAQIHRKGRSNGSAADALDRIINDYPSSMETPNAMLLMASYLADTVDGPEYDQGATNDAMNYYRDFLTLYPNNPAIKHCEDELARNREQYSQSKYLVGEFFYNYRDDYDSAAVFFNDSITIAPESRSASDSREYLTRIAKIKQHYPNGDWPRRTSWQFIMFWMHWDPLDGIDEPAEAQPASQPEVSPTPGPAPADNTPAQPTSSAAANEADTLS